MPLAEDSTASQHDDGTRITADSEQRALVDEQHSAIDAGEDDKDDDDDETRRPSVRECVMRGRKGTGTAANLLMRRSWRAFNLRQHQRVVPRRVSRDKRLLSSSSADLDRSQVHAAKSR